MLIEASGQSLNQLPLLALVTSLLYALLGTVVLGIYAFSKLGRSSSDDLSDIAPPTSESAQRVLVVANQGLANPTLTAELDGLAQAGPLEVAIIVPVAAASRLRALSDDVDAEAGRAQERLDAALGALSERGVDAKGRLDLESSPEEGTLTGLRAFPADQVLLLPGDELDWEGIGGLAERIRSETGVNVTELG